MLRVFGDEPQRARQPSGAVGHVLSLRALQDRASERRVQTPERLFPRRGGDRHIIALIAEARAVRRIGTRSTGTARAMGHQSRLAGHPVVHGQLLAM